MGEAGLPCLAGADMGPRNGEQNDAGMLHKIYRNRGRARKVCVCRLGRVVGGGGPSLGRHGVKVSPQVRAGSGGGGGGGDRSC